MMKLARAVLYMAFVDLLKRDVRHFRNFRSQATKGRRMRAAQLRAYLFLGVPNSMLDFWAPRAGLQTNSVNRIAERIFDGKASESEIEQLFLFLRPDSRLGHGEETPPASGDVAGQEEEVEGAEGSV